MFARPTLEGAAFLSNRCRRLWGKWDYPDNQPRWNGGVILTEDLAIGGERIKVAPLDHPNLQFMERLLDRTNQSFSEAIGFFLDSFTPVTVYEMGQGCMSGNNHPREQKGRIHVSVSIDDVTGGLEGVVHETAHQWLHCYGVELETHDGSILLNKPEELYFSPIRREVKRPMSAVLHGVYAWMWMLEVDLVADNGLDYLQYNVPKVRRGLLEIHRHARWTTQGWEFIQELTEWGSELLSKGEFRLKSSNREEILPDNWISYKEE